jgi:hypothetical protein
MVLVAYVLCSAVGYFAGLYLPYSVASPYLPLLISYHLLVLCLIFRVAITGEQKLGLSVPLPLAVLGHLACVGGMIGMVMARREVPFFAILQYIVPGIAPFEIGWIFEGNKHRHVAVETTQMGKGTLEDYAEFVEYLKKSSRRYQRAGRSVTEEYAAWLKHRDRKRPVAKPALIMVPAETQDGQAAASHT